MTAQFTQKQFEPSQKLTVLHHTLRALYTLGASRPRLAIVVPAALIVQRHRASRAARPAFFSAGLGGLDGLGLRGTSVSIRSSKRYHNTSAMGEMKTDLAW
jgi:hypothetical protein